MDGRPRPLAAVREGLLNLYDPTALLAGALTPYLVARGVPAVGTALAEHLLDAIEGLRPLDHAPTQSHGWRCSRYLQLRYVDCQSHAAVARDLGLSLRQASRVHLDALQLFAQALGLSMADGSATAPAGAPSAETAVVEVALAEVAQLRPEDGLRIDEVLHGVRATAQRFASGHGAALELRVPIDLPPVRSNRVALRQILFNLLVYLVASGRARNASNHLTILAGGQVIGNCVDVSLACGRTADPVTAGRWSGAPGDAVAAASALAAAQALARSQACEITTMDGADGPAVRLKLPVGARTVLLIDDNPDVGALFSRMLMATAYTLVPARTAGRALALARESLPQAILLDVILPTRDGWEILATLKDDRRTAAIPIVICSVLPDRELALSLGATDFLAKPVTRASLIAALDRLFARPSASAGVAARRGAGAS